MSLTDAFRAQAANCAALGSPFMERLMGLMADRLGPVHGPVAARLFAWPATLAGLATACHCGWRVACMRCACRIGPDWPQSIRPRIPAMQISGMSYRVP